MSRATDDAQKRARIRNFDPYRAEYDRGVRDTLARLTEPEAVDVVGLALAERAGDDDGYRVRETWALEWRDDAASVLEKLAAALAPREETER